MRDIEGLRSRLRRIESNDPVEIRAHCLDAVLEHAAVDFAAFFPYALRDGELVHGAWTVRGDATAAQTLGALEGAPAVSRGCWDPRRPRPIEKQRFVSIEHGPVPLETIARSEGYRLVYQPLGIRDHARILLYAGRRFLGWFGLMHGKQGAFSRRDLQGLNRAVPEIAAAITAAADLEPTAKADLHMVVDPQTLAVEWATPSARAWLRHRADKLRIFLRALRSGQASSSTYLDACELRVVELVGECGLRFHVHVTRAEPVYCDAAASLSPRQYEVARLAATGATYAEIGDTLAIAGNTVAAHIKSIYEKLGICTRAELASVFARAP
jgi:DNA-binding CsgD family transcriptional regulator